MKKFYRICLTAALLCCCLIVFASYATAQKFGKITDEEWEMGPPPQVPDAAAVIIFNNGRMDTATKSYPWLTRHVRIKVFDPDRADAALRIEIPYYKGSDVSVLKAHAIAPDGTKTKIQTWYKKKIDDIRYITGTFEGVVPGSIVEYTYRRDNELRPWVFQDRLFTLNSRYEVYVAMGYTFNIVQTGVPIDKREPVHEEMAAGDLYTWELTNIPGYKDEPYTSAVQSSLVTLRFRLLRFSYGNYEVNFQRTWGELGEVLEEWFVDFIGDTASIKQVADSLCGDDSGMACVKTLYEFVRKEITEDYEAYDDINSARDVLKLGRAPAQYKNNLLAALLKSRGINACPLWIGTRDEYGIPLHTIVDLSQFNREICYITIDSISFPLDAAEEDVCFPYVEPDLLVDAGFKVEGDSSNLIPIQHYPRQNGLDCMSELWLHDDGSAICSLTMHVRGHSMYQYTDFIKDSISQNEVVNTMLSNVTIPYDIQSASAVYDSIDDRLWFELVLALPHCGEQIDDVVFVSPCFMPLAKNRFIAETRTFPIDFGFEQTHRQYLRVHYPESFEIAELAPMVSLSHSGASYKRTTQKQAGTLLIRQTCKIERPLFSQVEYGIIKSMFEAIEAAREDQIIFSMASQNTAGTPAPADGDNTE